MGIDKNSNVIDNGSDIEDTKLRVINILNKLKEKGQFSTEVGFSDDSIAFNCIRDYINKHKDKFLISEIYGGADSYIISVTEKQIRNKRKNENKKRISQ
jgi:hypothetical protein